jgi:hypothetical protein
MSRLSHNLFVRLLKLYFEDSIALAKIRATAYYVKAIGIAREIFIIDVAFRCALLLMLAGFVTVHAAVFWLLPWSPRCKAIVLLVLGGLYFLIPLLVMLKICSQKFWMKRSGASKLVKEATGLN